MISLTTRQLMTALKKTGDVYNEMGGRLMDELPAVGWDSFADMLHVYRGVAGAFPDILAVHKVNCRLVLDIICVLRLMVTNFTVFIVIFVIFHYYVLIYYL